MHRRIALLAFLACALSLIAADPIPISKLIEQLGDKQFAVRERASKALRDRGPDSLPELRKAAQSTDAEVRRRAEDLVKALVIVKALQPTLIKLPGGTMTMGEMLQVLDEQTGTTANHQRANIAAEFKKGEYPYWEVVKTLERHHNCSLMGALNRLNYDPRPNSPFVIRTGPFRLSLTRIHEDKDLKFDAPGTPRTGLLTFSLDVDCEPKLGFISVEKWKIARAEDDHGNLLILPTSSPPSLTGYFDSYLPMNLPYKGHLNRVDEKSRTLKVLRGTVPVKLVIERKSVLLSERFADALGKRATAGGDTVEVSSVKINAQRVHIELRVPEPAKDWDRRWHSRMRLEDESGKAFDSHSEGMQSGAGRYWISRDFDLNQKGRGPATRLVIEDWIIHDHEIPFEFKDVPLP